MTLAEQGRRNLVMTLLAEIKRAKIIGRLLSYSGDPDGEAEAKLQKLCDALIQEVREVARKHKVTLTEDNE